MAGLVSRRQKDLAIEIIEAEMPLGAARGLAGGGQLVLTGEPVEIARRLRARAELIIRPK